MIVGEGSYRYEVIPGWEHLPSGWEHGDVALEQGGRKPSQKAGPEDEIPGLARFRTQAPGWKVLCAREGEIVIGTHQNAAAGRCLMRVTDPRTVKNRLHLDLTSSAWSWTVLASPATSTVRKCIRRVPGREVAGLRAIRAATRSQSRHCGRPQGAVRPSPHVSR